DKYRRLYDLDVDPDRHVTVCCGSTETMLSTLLAVLDPGDQVIIFEPYYENYGPGCIIAGAEPVWVPLEPPEVAFDPAGLRRAVPRRPAGSPAHEGDRLKSPNHPAGQVFSPPRARADRRSLPRARPARHHRRDLRAHRLRWLVPYADRHAPGDGRADGHDLGNLEILLGDRLARRLRRRAARDQRGNSSRSRLRDGGSAASSARGGRGRAGAAGQLLHLARRDVPGQAGSAPRLARKGRVRDVEAARRLLRPHRRGALPAALSHRGRHRVR